MRKRQKLMYINGIIYSARFGSIAVPKTKTRLMIDIHQTDGYTCIITPTVCLVYCNHRDVRTAAGEEGAVMEPPRFPGGTSCATWNIHGTT